MSLKEHIFDGLFQNVEEFYECKGILHIGNNSTGKSGKWTAHPYCVKRLKHWVGFNEIQYSNTDKVCPVCLTILCSQIGSAKQISAQKEGTQTK